MKKKILWGLLALLVVIQFFRIDKTNPEADPAKDFITMTNPPEAIASMLKTSCYDCHSAHTVYPWYTNIAPVSWWIKKHIDEGREHFNFSEWGNYDEGKKEHKLEEFYSEVEHRKMPLKSYLPLHPEAKLSDDQIKLITGWLVEIGGEGIKEHDH